MVKADATHATHATHESGASQASGSSDANVGQKPTLREARVRRLMSANELGKRAGVAASTILKIEQGAVPRLATIGKLAGALGMEADEIAWPGNPFAFTYE